VFEISAYVSDFLLLFDATLDELNRLLFWIISPQYDVEAFDLKIRFIFALIPNYSLILFTSPSTMS